MIPISDCKDGFLYKLNSRNLDYGIYCEADQSFIGIREKFNYRFLEVDGHRELKSFGCSALPTECLEIHYPDELWVHDESHNDNKQLFEFLIEKTKNL